VQEMAGLRPGFLRIFSFVCTPAADLSPFLPSALVIEHVCSVPVGGFSLQWVLQPEGRSLVFR